MGGAVKKATKRYNKQHGAKKAPKGGVTKGAKGGKPVQRSNSKPRTGSHKKGSSRGSKTGGKGSGEDEAPPAKPSVKDMDVDAFLDGGFQDITAPEKSSEEEDQSSADEGPDEEDGEDMSEGEVDDEEGAQDAELDGAATGANEEEDEEEGSEEEEGGKGNDAVTADNKRLKGEVARHKAQLEALRENDPEFYAYLQQTDANLLGFGEDVEDEEGEEDEEEGSEDEEGSGDEDEAPKKKVKEAKPTKDEASQDDDAEEEGKPSAPLTVTSQLVNKWCAAAKADAPLGTMKQLVRAYRMACHYGDTEEEVEAGMKIASGAIYNTVLMFMLREADGIFKRMLGLDKIELGKAKGKARELTAEDVARVTSTTKWRKVGPLIKSYLGNTLHALAAMTDAPLMAFTLRRIRASAALMTPQPLRKFADKLLKASLTIFGSSEEATPRLQAFLAIRALSLVMPPPFMEKCLRGVYRSYLANSKFVSASSAPHIAFMQTCAIELWGLDLQMSYAHAFSAIRQLAVSLRGALNMKTKDGYKEVYSWQGVNALELWARVLGAHADKTELRPLVYPLTQLLLGAARLVPTPRFFPLRLRLIRATHRLAVSTGQYVPLSAPLLEMLNWAELHKPPKAGAGSPQDLSLMLRAGKSSLRTSAFQEEIVTQVCELLAEHLAHWSCSPAFPELSLLPVLNLRRFAKTTKVDKFRKAVKGLMEAIEKNKVWVGNARDGADFAPKDVSKAATFLQQEFVESKSPLQQYAKMLAGRAVQRAAARSTDAVDFTTSKGKKRAAEDENDSDEGVEEEDQQMGKDDASDDDEDEGHTGSEGEGASDGDSEDEKESTAAVAHKAKKAKKAGKPLSADMLAALGGFGEGDQDEVLGQYQLSDDEEEDGSGRTKQRQGKGVLGLKAPAPQNAGGVNGIKGSKGKGGSEEESSSGDESEEESSEEEQGNRSESEGSPGGMEGGSGDGEEDEDEDSAEIMGEDSDADEQRVNGAAGMDGGWGSESEEGESDEEGLGRSEGGGMGKGASAGSKGQGGRGNRGGGRGRAGRGDSRGGARGGGRFGGRRGGGGGGRGGGRGGRSDGRNNDGMSSKSGGGGKGGRARGGGGGRGGRRGGFRGGGGRGR